jgi:ABC-type iron transport system FetAB permease component
MKKILVNSMGTSLVMVVIGFIITAINSIPMGAVLIAFGSIVFSISYWNLIHHNEEVKELNNSNN